MRSHKTTPALLLCCLLATLAGDAAELDAPADEPVFDGRPLSAWVDELLELRRLHNGPTRVHCFVGQT